VARLMTTLLLMETPLLDGGGVQRRRASREMLVTPYF